MTDLARRLRDLASKLSVEDAAACRRAAEVIEKLLAVVQDIGSDKTLRTRSSGYHARRVALTCGAVLAELDGTYKHSTESRGNDDGSE